ncbi:MAG: methyltransferase domain-containing protein [Planctomycetota bacterium]|nr:methyltransferase domain-containing protein [Planctomycetota bacterium]
MLPTSDQKTAREGEECVDGQSAIRLVIDTYTNFAERLYSRIRFLILRQPFLDEIGQYLPRGGRILDLGCGFGLFSLYFALRAPRCQFTGVDLNDKRIQRAQENSKKLGLSNIHYQVGSALDWHGQEHFDAIYMLDLVHHLPAAEVPHFLEKTSALLKPGGVLLMKEVADRPRYKMLFTLALDRLMVGREPIHYWPPAELARVLEGLGFEVKTHRMTDFLPYPHILYIAKRTNGLPNDS